MCGRNKISYATSNIQHKNPSKVWGQNVGNSILGWALSHASAPVAIPPNVKCGQLMVPMKRGPFRRTTFHWVAKVRHVKRFLNVLNLLQVYMQQKAKNHWKTKRHLDFLECASVSFHVITLSYLEKKHIDKKDRKKLFSEGGLQDTLCFPPPPFPLYFT